MTAGVLIVFEGGEGAGKSTQVDRLALNLLAAGLNPTVTREPGATLIGAELRQLLLASAPGIVPAKAEALMYAADRAIHVQQVLLPALERGDIVLCDRYEDSSIAYQGAGRQLGVDTVAALSTWASGNLHPDLVILLDIDPTIGLARAGRRGPADRIEQETLDFHQRIRDQFLARAAMDLHRYLVLDATEPADVLADEIVSHVVELLAVHCEMATEPARVISLTDRRKACEPCSIES